MTMLRSAIGIALPRAAPAARFFSSVARGSPGCSGATSALRRTAPAARFFSSVARGSPGCCHATSALRRPALTSGFLGNGGGGSSGFRRMMCSYGNGGQGFWNQGLSWKRSDILFFGITGAVLYVVQRKVRALQEEKWQRQIKDIEMRPYMMDKEKEDTVNIPFH
ncbi:hypothetical protein ACQJBY_052362 [Aegilops geniculata]